jgi:hypothetical protein
MKTTESYRLQKIHDLIKEGVETLNRTSLSPADREDILGEATLSVLVLSPEATDEKIIERFRSTIEEVRKGISSVPEAHLPL